MQLGSRPIHTMRLPIQKWIKDALFKAYAPSGWARSPNHVSLDLTRRCNLRCRMCYYYGKEKQISRRFNELTSQEIISLIVNRLSGVNYDLTGGEPFIRTDLPEILAAIRKRGCGRFVTTNGTLITREIAARIVGEELLNWVSVSIHGLEETHDMITRTPGSFKRALKGIEYLINERVRQGAALPGVNICCTITQHNIGDAEGLAALLNLTGVENVSFGHASFIMSDIKKAHQDTMDSSGLHCEPAYDELLDAPPEIQISPAQLDDYVGAIARLRVDRGLQRICTSPKGYGPEDIRNHYSDMGWKYKSSCTYPWRNLRVAPDGAITPCVGYVVGNVREQDIKRIWNNERFRKFRKCLYRHKLFPGCIRCCKLK